MKTDLLRQVGATTDGKPTMAGVYRLMETEGIPLEVILMGLREKGFVISWMHFYQEAASAGMEHGRILSRLDPAIVDGGHEPEFRDYVIRALNKLVETGHLVRAEKRRKHVP